MKTRYILILLSLFIGMSIKAQISEGGTPYFASRSVAKSHSIPKISLPPINLEKVRKEDEKGKEGPYRFAYAHKVNINPNNAGRWYTEPNGDRYWVLEIESKGAKTLNFTFSDFYLPKGAKLFFYNKDRSDIRGAFTYKNNKPYRKLGVAPIKGDQITIEYYQPAQLSEKPVLQFATVAHDYKGVFELADTMRKSENTAKAFGETGNCHINVACPEGNPWEKQIRSVVLYATNNGTGLASSVLINNTNQDRTPYLLTAEHNVSDSRSTPQTAMFIFNYQSATCANPQAEPSKANSISGAQLLEVDLSSVPREGNPDGNGNLAMTFAETRGIDFALLQLSTAIPNSYNAYYNGWDASNRVPSSFVGIHHSQADIKKISLGNNIKRPDTIIPVPINERQKQYFWEVIWNQGSSERGASGSPLIDPNGNVIGTLQGGQARCNNTSSFDLYVAFSRSFSFLKEYLAPGSNVTSLGGLDSPRAVNSRIGTNLEEESISVFPNPVQNILYVSVNEIDIKKINLDVLGISGKIIDKQVYTVKQHGADRLEIDVRQLPKGVYFIKVNNTTKKFVVSK
ncbi:T9SS type A sorting domain-containing protein [Aquimarina sp. I32.4]|uniref:T9SS type A sorting domain-containing protein n=1 Tax=Aquimarina sp. I32.4 TaxID=2053903 RepID=UPI000CDE75B6|nr:T9SS type A sorting domain-containing protein [Aquimarina sp. I32.4]